MGGEKRRLAAIGGDVGRGRAEVRVVVIGEPVGGWCVVRDGGMRSEGVRSRGSFFLDCTRAGAQPINRGR